MNPELVRDGDNPEGWVAFAQGRLAAHLAAEAADGAVTLSETDDKFGPITEASVEFFQVRESLSVTGVIDEATWESLEQEPATPVDADPDGAGVSLVDPVHLQVPFELQIRWEQMELERMLTEFEQLELRSHPAATFTLPQPVGRLFGTGGLLWLEQEFQTQPQVFFEATTRAIVGWSGDKGIELGADNDLDLGLRFGTFDLFVRGEFDARLYPMEPSATIEGAGTLNIRVFLDALGR